MAAVVPLVEISPGVFSAIIQVLIALVASGVAVKLLTVRQDRRKIAGEASTQEANAASTLSGAALQMVEAAQRTAREAEARAREAEERAQAANEATEKIRLASDQLWAELNAARWKIHWQDTHLAVMQGALEQAGIKVPPPPPPPETWPNHPPPR